MVLDLRRVLHQTGRRRRAAYGVLRVHPHRRGAAESYAAARVASESHWSFFGARRPGELRTAPLAAYTLLQLSPPIADNYAVRTILGYAAWRLPAGAVTKRHRDAAKTALENFDLVLVLDDDDNDDDARANAKHVSSSSSSSSSSKTGASDDLLRTHLGIEPCDRPNPQQRDDDKDWALRPEEHAALETLNRHDHALFRHARRLRALDQIANELLRPPSL